MFQNVLQEDILQVIPYGLDEIQISEVLKYMPHCKATSWHEHARDIIVKEGGKDIGIKEILHYYNLERSEIMAFGDGDNDVKNARDSRGFCCDGKWKRKCKSCCGLYNC